MAECPQFQLMPQVVPIYRPQQPPPPVTSSFPMPGQPIFPLPPPSHFGYPPLAWSPVPQYPPPPPPPLLPQSAFDHAEEDDDYNSQPPQHAFNNNNISYSNNNFSVEDSQNEQLLQQGLQQPQRPYVYKYARNVSNKFDTRYEEFRKYLEEMGILSTFTNIIAEMYQDPLRPNDPMGYIRDKLNCTHPDMVELSNLRLWCDQYQTRTLRLEKELKHVIERLKKHEPYITDDSLFSENSSDYDCKTCVLDITKQGQGHILGINNENANYESVKNNNKL